MKTLLLLFSIVGLLFSCSKEKKQPNVPIAKVIPTAPKLTVTDTLEITSKAIVVFQKDSIAVEKLLKEATNEDAFYTASDDYGYYIANATEFMEKQKIRMIDANKKYLKFVGADATPLVIRVDTLQGLGGMYFFTPAKKPHLVDITMPKEEYKEYFGN